MKKICRNRNFENVNKCMFTGIGKYNIPVIRKQEYESCDFIGFNYAARCQDRINTGIHFFLDDYQFQRLWVMPDYYIPMLKQFKCVMTPDYSIYADYPLALQIYNHYRKHWLGAYMQRNGIKVIPTISWSDGSSYEWCFDGEPTQGVVSVSAVGCCMNKLSQKLFLEGYKRMLDKLEPETTIFYGTVPDGCTGNIVRIKSYQEMYKERRM